MHVKHNLSNCLLYYIKVIIFINGNIMEIESFFQYKSIHFILCLLKKLYLCFRSCLNVSPEAVTDRYK